MWRDFSLPRHNHEVVEAPQRIHDSHFYVNTKVRQMVKGEPIVMDVVYLLMRKPLVMDVVYMPGAKMVIKDFSFSQCILNVKWGKTQGSNLHFQVAYESISHYFGL